MINNYLYRKESDSPRLVSWRVGDFDERLTETVDTLKPTLWEFVITQGSSTVILREGTDL
jgi:hypothetical protein